MSYTSRKTKPPRPRWCRTQDLGIRSFLFKSSRPSWFGKSGRPQNITNIQVFERVSEWNKFVDIDILGQHSSIKWGLVASVLSISSFANEWINERTVHKFQPWRLSKKQTDASSFLISITRYFENTFSFASQKFFWRPQLSVFSSPGYVSTDLRLKEACRPEWHPPRASRWFGDILGSHCGIWGPSSRAEGMMKWLNPKTCSKKIKTSIHKISKIPQKYSTGRKVS